MGEIFSYPFSLNLFIGSLCEILVPKFLEVRMCVVSALFEELGWISWLEFNLPDDVTAKRIVSGPHAH